MPVNTYKIPMGREIGDRAKIESRPMKHLYFQHANGEMTLINKNVGDYTDQFMFALIHKDIHERNSDFVITKEEVWDGYDGKRFYDVGSKTEKYVVF